MKNKILHDQLDMLRDNQKRHSKDEQEITHEKEQEIIRKTRKALLEELQRKMEINLLGFLGILRTKMEKFWSNAQFTPSFKTQKWAIKMPYLRAL